MDKKKRLIQLTEGMLLCCVIVVMTLLCIGIIKKEVKNTKGKLTETTGWYRIQDNKKVQVDLNQKIKADPFHLATTESPETAVEPDTENKANNPGELTGNSVAERQKQIRQLEARLHEAVRNEEYEAAARYRDQIRELKEAQAQ